MPTLENELNDLIERALAAAARGDPEEALSLFTRASGSFPGSKRAWLGRILLTGQIHQSADLMPLVRFALDGLASRDAIGFVIPDFEGDKPWHQTPYQLAERASRHGMKGDVAFLVDLGLALSWSDPVESGKLWLLKAENELERGMLQEAIGSLQQADALGATSPACRYLHALEHERRGEPDLALAAYLEATGHKAIKHIALVGAVRLLGNRGNLQGAFELCRDAIKLGYSTFEIWKIYTKIALLLGLNGEVQRGIAGMNEFPEGSQGSSFAGFPSTEARTLEHATFLKKLPRLLAQEGLLFVAHIRVRDWAFSLPQACERWPLGALASGSLTAAIIDRERRAFVSCHTPSGRQIDPGTLSFDALHGWCYLLERGLVSQVIFAANAPFAPRVQSSIEGLAAQLGGADRLSTITLAGRD